MPQTTKTMPMISVGLADSLAVIRVAGRANFNSSVHFKTVVSELRQRGYKSFILDLTECITMDSTFLGVLAGLALHANDLPGPALELQLFNPNTRVSDLLENLGVVHLFKICSSSVDAPLTPVEATNDPSKEQLNRTCLEAHQTLMAIDPNNIPKFKEVTQFLAEDLNRVTAK